MFGDQNSSHSAGVAVQISSRRHDKVTIFDLSGDIDFANSRQLRESVLREIDENRTSHATVNLSAVRYIDSLV
jgi:anti-anti-sigma factor